MRLDLNRVQIIELQLLRKMQELLPFEYTVPLGEQQALFPGSVISHNVYSCPWRKQTVLERMLYRECQLFLKVAAILRCCEDARYKMDGDP